MSVPNSHAIVATPISSGGGLITEIAFRAHFSYDGDVNSPTADQVSTLGLITRFTATPVPEPSTAALLALGLGVFARRRSIMA